MAKQPLTPEQKRKDTLIGVFVVGTIFAVVFGTWIIPDYLEYREEQRILTEGTAATAVIRDIRETGNMYNHKPEVELTLEIAGPDGTTFTGRALSVFSSVKAVKYPVGTTVHVKYDPADPGKVALVGL
jgi:hypothetical protein